MFSRYSFVCLSLLLAVISATHNNVKADNSDTCVSCKKVAAGIKPLLSEEAIKRLDTQLIAVCYSIPSETYRLGCLKSLEYYIGLAEYLLKHSEEETCIKQGYCKAASGFSGIHQNPLIGLLLADAKLCDACKTTVQGIKDKLKDQKFREDVKETLVEFCQLIPDQNSQAKCLNIIKNDFDNFVSQFDSLPNEFVCKELTLC